MNKLDQLRQMSEVVADTGDIQAISTYRPVDATTNPSLILKAIEGGQYPDLIDRGLSWARRLELPAESQVSALVDWLATAIGCQILELIPGRVSTEVDARLSFDTGKTVQRAQRLLAHYEEFGVSRERVLIKIASTWEGIKAAEILQAEGVDCNLTLLFHPVQALAAAQAGAWLISPFVGRIYDWHCKAGGVEHLEPEDDPGVTSVRTIYQMFKELNYQTIVMGASFRHTGQIEALAGCDRLTIAPALLEQLSEDQGKLARRLPAESAEKPLEIECHNESDFRLQLNSDPMATEKLAEGIRLFIGDQQKLERLLLERI